jgi:hypothetical protein
MCFVNLISLLSFEKMKVGLGVHHAVCVSPSINLWMAEPIFIKLGMYILAPDP